MAAKYTPSYAPHQCGSDERIAILLLLSQHPRGITMQRVAATTHIDMQTTRRILEALHSDDIAQPLDPIRTPGQLWRTRWAALQESQGRPTGAGLSELITTPMPAHVGPRTYGHAGPNPSTPDARD